MAYIYFSIRIEHAPTLLDWLNRDDELAFVVSDGPDRWRAVHKLDMLLDGKLTLWHIPGGLLFDGGREPIKDPFSGWATQHPGVDASEPYFGPGHPAIIHLDLKILSRGGSKAGWIGNHYRVIGQGATSETERWWRRFRSFLKRNFKVARG